MTNIKIALTNLGKYNEGELVYTWLELPATDEEISAAFAEIGVAPNTEYEEHFITDYEAPFEIEEYASVRRLNEVAEALEGLNIPESIFEGNYDTEDVINFAQTLESNGYIDDAAEHVGDFISDEDLDEYVANAAKEGGWARVKFLLGQITDLHADYYMFDGYANVCDITHAALEGIVSDLMYEMQRELDV